MAAAYPSALEAEPEAVEHLQPGPFASGSVEPLVRPHRPPDAEEASGLRREGDRLRADHPEPRALGVEPVHNVEHGPRAEPRRADAETRVPDGIREPPVQRRPEEHREATARVDHAPPAVGEPDALERRERLEEVASEARVHLVVELEAPTDTAAEVVRRVEAAPQDPVVGRQPEVVEAVRGIGQPFAPGPSDRGALLGRERFGHEDVVVHGYDVAPDLAQERWVPVRREDHPIGEDRAVTRPHAHTTALALERTDGRGLVDPNAEPERGVAKS